ncbi:hypothetical protein KBI33_00615 [Candidatus Shapirobacteria bacterium]|nr:hypothetical protein [Candidatus Shapirobacteria bacterium]
MPALEEEKKYSTKKWRERAENGYTLLVSGGDQSMGMISAYASKGGEIAHIVSVFFFKNFATKVLARSFSVRY